MADTASVKIIKSMPYRGGTKLWSNRYHITDGLPDTQAAFDTLATNIVNAEKAIYFSDVTITAAVGYEVGSDVPVFSKTFSAAGTLVGTGTQQTPGDAAAMCRYATDIRTVKNHPLYLFNYWHGARVATGAVGDLLVTIQKNAMGTYATSWETGFSDGTTTHKRCGPRGAVALSHQIDQYVRHRDFVN